MRKSPFFLYTDIQTFQTLLTHKTFCFHFENKIFICDISTLKTQQYNILMFICKKENYRLHVTFGLPRNFVFFMCLYWISFYFSRVTSMPTIGDGKWEQHKKLRSFFPMRWQKVTSSVIYFLSVGFYVTFRFLYLFIRWQILMEILDRFYDEFCFLRKYKKFRFELYVATIKMKHR